MIKSAIKHSAIRSAIRKPFVPNDDGYREHLKRSVFELNGTQWGQLSEPVVLEEFEIELACYAVDSPNLNQTFLAGTDFRFQVVGATDKLILSYRDTSDIRIDVVFDELEFNHRKINSITIIRVGDVCTTTLNGVSQSKTITNIKSFAPDSIGVNTSGLGGNDELVGMILGVKIWTNGGRNTGDLILNVPFDESGSDYQRNHAFTQGAPIVFSPDLIVGDWISNGDGSYTYVGASNEAVLDSDFLEGQYYEIEFTVSGRTTGRVEWKPGNGETVSSFNGNGTFKTYIKASVAGIRFTAGFFDGGRFDGTVSNISTREWSGAILHNALPEDWMQIERKRWWDYWLGPELFTQELWTDPEIAGDHWTYLPESNKWRYIGDGSLNALQLISSANQPTLGVLSGTVERTAGVGTFGLCASTVGEYTIDTFHITNPVRFKLTLDNTIGSGQQFKRRSGSLSVLLSKPSYRRKLEIAQ